MCLSFKLRRQLSSQFQTWFKKNYDLCREKTASFTFFFYLNVDVHADALLIDVLKSHCTALSIDAFYPIPAQGATQAMFAFYFLVTENKPMLGLHPDIQSEKLGQIFNCIKLR